MKTKKEKLWEAQNIALRNPSDIFGSNYSESGITKETLKYKATASFIDVLSKLKINLIISREYENLLLSIKAQNGKISQSFFHVPHPSGIAINRKSNTMYVAATRNPNQIIAFKPGNISPREKKFLIPIVSKYYPGSFYFHDLAIIDNKIYANSVGTNSIIEININSPDIERPTWWPKCIEQNKKPNFSSNYIQLNSIAAGKTLKDSFFTASSACISKRKPGDLNYPVNKKGVIFSGNTRETFITGLTRPHSARIYKNEIWVANSGYGSVGKIKAGKYVEAFQLGGWTRGLCFKGDFLFVGVSRVLPRFKNYAPGIAQSIEYCSVVAINLQQNKIVGKIDFPYGNQIFGIDYFNYSQSEGFPFKDLKQPKEQNTLFYNYTI